MSRGCMCWGQRAVHPCTWTTHALCPVSLSPYVPGSDENMSLHWPRKLMVRVCVWVTGLAPVMSFFFNSPLTCRSASLLRTGWGLPVSCPRLFNAKWSSLTDASHHKKRSSRTIIELGNGQKSIALDVWLCDCWVCSYVCQSVLSIQAWKCDSIHQQFYWFNIIEGR